MKFKTTLSVITTVLLSAAAHASVQSELNSLFDSLGSSSNVTGPQVYKGQSAGYYTGGSLYVRNPVSHTQIASMTLPSYRAGCGGIDLFSGGFSFINSRQLEATFRNIINNAGSYAFMLAMKSITPEIASVMDYAEGLSNDVNQMNINSCETGAALVGGLWPKTQIAQKQVCQTIGTGEGIFDDWAAARQGCGSGGQQSQINRQGQQNDKFKSMVLDNTNLVWSAIQKNTFLANDKRLAEFFMSLSGTVIFTSEGAGDDANHKLIELPSLAANDKLIKALLHGGEAKIYRCDERDKCLGPRERTISISSNSALQPRIRNMLDEMTQKVIDDTPLTQAEIGLLNSTSLPIYKMLDVQVVFAKGSGGLNIGQYADVIALDVLFKYLQDSLKTINQQLANLGYSKEQLDAIREGINQAREQVRAQEKSSYQHVTLSNQLVRDTQSLEQMMAGELAASLSSAIK